ncbi:unnamed protein product [Closterium sp. NIES-64]|nr:unnamed protein product [Closterium sp. NIES-64]
MPGVHSFPDATELPRWADLLKSGVAIFDLDYDAILAAMYVVTISAEGDCYLCVPPDPGIEAAALGASDSAAPGASRSFFRDSTTLTPLSRPVAVSLADPSGGPDLAHSSTVLPCPAVPSGSLSDLHLPSFSTNLPAPTCVPFVEGRQRTAPHSSEFPPTETPLQTLHMDVWGPARVRGQGHEHYFLLVVDDYSRYTTVFPLRRKGEVIEVLITWIRAARRQLSESFGSDLPVLRLHSDRGGEFSSDLLRAFCRAEGIRQTFTLPASPQKNGIAERRIGMVIDVARPPPVDPLPPQGLAPSGVSRVDPLKPVEVAVDSGAARGAEPVGAGPGGAEPVCAEPGGAEPGVDASEGAEPGGVEPWVVESWSRAAGAEGPTAGGAARGGGTASAVAAGGAGGAGPGGARPGGSGAAGARVTAAAGAAGPGGARTGGTGAAGTGGAAGVGAGGAGAVTAGGAAGAGAARGAGAGGAAGVGAGDPRAGGTSAVSAGSGGAAQPRPYFVPLLQQVLRLPPSTGPTPPLLCLPPDQSQSQLQPASPLPGPSPYSGPTGGLAERREPMSRPASPACTARTGRGVPRQRPPLVPGTHQMALCPSSVPLRGPLPSPPTSSLADGPDPKSDSLRAASPTITCLLATVVTDPLFASTTASALVAELVDFAAACRLDYAASLVAESESICPPSVGGECALGMDVLEDRQEDFECFVAAVPHLVSMLIAPEGDPDAPDTPTPRSYTEAIEGPYSSQWQVKRPPSSPPVFKARYVARGFSQLQGVDFFRTFSPTPKMTTLRVLLHVAAQRDYKLHSLNFSTAFLQGSLHKEIWLRRPPCFTGLMTTFAALGFAPSTADPSLFLRTDTSLLPFYILVYVNDLVFATADTTGLARVKSELQNR